MNFIFVIFLINLVIALCSQYSHTHQNRQWNSYNANKTAWTQSHNNSNTTTSTTPETTTLVVKNKVNITVYYETLCPASVGFFTKQLKPVVEKLGSHLDVQLVPYGHARTIRVRGRYLFRCQHGPAECYGNKLHACALDALRNNTQAALFNACLMQYTARNFRFDYVSVLNWCGYKLNVSINGVWECVNSERGSILLKDYGILTHALRPHFVPYLVLDGSTDNQDLAGTNLMLAVCQMLQPAPRNCYSYTEKNLDSTRR